MSFKFFKLNPELSETLTEQIESGIKAQIANKTLLPGEQIPVMRSLSKSLGCGVVTINKALTHLQDDLILVSRGNKGIFVSESLTPSDIEQMAQSSIADKLEELILIAKQQDITKDQFIDLVEQVYTSLEELSNE